MSVKQQKSSLSLHFVGLFHSFASNRQPSLIPRYHTAREYAHGLEAFPPQDLCRSDRAAFLVSDGDDSVCTVHLQLVKMFVECGQRTQHRPGNVAPFPDELVRVPDIEHKR